MRDPAVLVATGLGTGCVPIAPGTVGSALAVAIWWLLLAELPRPVQAGIVLATFGLGLLLLHRVIQRYSVENEPVKDEPAIVIDEFVGCWAALASIPKTWPWALAAFALFRLADIAKPWPISWADRSLPGAIGIMLDDLLAGILVALLLVATQYALAG